MKRFYVLLALVLALPLIAYGQANCDPQIRQLDDAGRAAAEKNDPSWLEQNLADTFVSSNPQGMATDRNGSIGMRKSGQLKYTSVKTGEWTCKAYNNDTAVVNATAEVAGTYNGQDISGRYRNTRVWVKQGGQWKLVAFHSSRITQ